MTEKQFDVVGLGASTVDVITLVERFPSGRETQQAVGMIIQGGGPVATAVVTVSRLGGRSAMIDSIGDDWAADIVLRGLQSENVDVGLIERHPGHSTSISNILVSARDGARAILWLPGSVPELALSEAQKRAIQSARFLHLNGRHWNACVEAAKLARAHNVKISFDGGAHRFRPELRTLVPLTDVCIVAKDFAEQYTSEADPATSAELLLRAGPGIVAVTDGIHGSWVCTKDGLSAHQPAFPFEATVDTTGCGDSYHGGFLAGLLRGYPPVRAATIASAVAGMNSQHLGGRTGIPSFGEVSEFLRARGVAVG